MGTKIASMKPRNIYTLPLGAELTGPIIEKFLSWHEDDVRKYNFLESYLDGSEPRMVRKAPNELLVVNNFAGYIMNLNSAYLVGNPVQYQVTDGMDIDAILDAYKEQSISDVDSEIAEDCSIYGRAYELVYANEEAKPISVKLNVRSTIVVRDDTFAHKIMYAITATPAINDQGERIEGQWNIVVFDKSKIRSFKLNGDVLIQNGDEIDHFFGDVPVIEYANNRRFRGDFEPVVSLIDAYNILQSDRVIDREKLVDAILAFYGVNMTEEDRERIKKGRTITLPSDAKGEYIVKNINEADADVLRATIAKDIHKFSMTPDMTDEQFSGNSSGVAISYKLLPFEENCKVKERYFERGLMERFKLYNNFLSTQSKMKYVPTSDVDAIFTRSLPKNDLEISQMINNLIGTIDKPLLASQLSFVKDGEEAVRLAEEEGEGGIVEDNYGTEQPNEAEEVEE